MFEIRHYIDREGRDVFIEWLRGVRDVKAKAAIARRINRVAGGNFGDHKLCREGVWEFRIDLGPGYRVYYARSGKAVILLLCGGDKHTQEADLTKVCELWREWKRNNPNRENP